MPSQAPLQKITNLSSLLAQPAKHLTSQQQQQLLQNPDFLQIIKQVMTSLLLCDHIGRSLGQQACNVRGWGWFMPFSSNLCEGSTIHIVAVVLISQF